MLNQSGVHRDELVCLGLYGEALQFSHGSFGGWSPFGPARKVTRCEHNVLYELDGEPAWSGAHFVSGVKHLPIRYTLR